MQSLILSLLLVLQPSLFGRKNVALFVGRHLLVPLIIIFISASLKKLTYEQLFYLCIGVAYGLNYLSLHGYGFNETQPEFWGWLVIDGAVDAFIPYFLVRVLLKPKLLRSTAEETAKKNEKGRP